MTQREDEEERLLLDAIFRPAPHSPQEPEIFRRLRRLARECGLDVRRNASGYSVLAGDKVIAGERQPLAIKGVARELQRRHILAWE